MTAVSSASEILSSLDAVDLVASLGAVLRDPDRLAALADAADSPDVLLWFRERRSTLGAGLADDALRTIRAEARRRAKAAAEAERLERAIPPATYREREYPEAAVLGLLQRTDTEEPKVRANPWNLGTILREDSRLSGRFRWNELRCDMELRDNGAWRQVADVDDVNLCRWVSDVYGLDYKTGTAREQVLSVANERRINPVREYLEGLPRWDGEARLAKLLHAYFGAENTPLNASIGRCWIVSLAARALDPGCKVDTIPVLFGKQGTMKSTAVRALVPDVSWHSDSDIPLHHAQDQYQVLQGKWIFELAEFERYASRTDAAKIKAYATQRIDSYRESYGRRTVDRPRRVGLVATTNHDEVFVDATGARRFWPVRCGLCRPDLIEANRDQIWAEALHLYRKAGGRGEAWLLSKEETREVAAVADSFRQADPWEGAVAEHVDRRRVVTVDEILKEALEIKVGAQDRAAGNRVTAILRVLGWVKDDKRGPPDGKGPFRWRAPGGVV